jgi:antitoxin MazE
VKNQYSVSAILIDSKMLFGYTLDIHKIDYGECGMTAIISGWGNSQAIRLPKSILESLHLSLGDKVNISVDGEKIIVEPIKSSRKKFDIKELVKGIPDDFMASELFEDVSGKETW